MRIAALLLAALCWPALLCAQYTPYPAQVVRYQVPAPAAPTVRTSYIGTIGADTWCYWAIANYPAGPSPINGACINNASTLSATNTAVISWNRPRGATSVDIVRTSSTQFNGVCSACLLLNDSVALSLTDNGSITPGSFNIGAVLGSASADTTIDNINWVNPRLTSTLLWSPQSLGSGTPDASKVLLGDGTWSTVIPGALPSADVGSLVCYATATTGGACDDGNLFYDSGTLVTPTAFRLGSLFGNGIRTNGAAMDLLLGSSIKAQVTAAGIVLQGSFTLGNGAAAFAALGTPPNGTQVYCTDCASGSNPCTGSSTGAVAFRVNGAWQCL